MFFLFFYQMDGSCYSIHAEEGTIFSPSEVSALNTTDHLASSLFSQAGLDVNANEISHNAFEDTFVVVSASEVVTTSTPIRPTVSDVLPGDDQLLTSLTEFQAPSANNPPPLTSTPKKKMLKCSFCPYKTQHSSNLSRHKRIHNGQKWSCDECPNKYTTQYELDKHKRTSHIAPLICDCCSKQFKSRQGLAAHRRTVGKEYKFICQFCSMGFQTKEHLRAT